MSYRALAVLAILGLMLPLSAVAAQRQPARHKPGPTFTRGIVARLDHGGFVLQTTHHGSYQVTVSGATSITEKGRRGQVSLVPGMHVGVHGFVHRQAITAIYVHVYPSRAKPKPFTLRGSVTRVSGTVIVISTGGMQVTVTLNGQTAVRYGNALSTTSALAAGQQVEVRVAREGSALIAVRIHIYHHKSVGRHVRLTGTVTGVTAGSVTVRTGSSVVTIAVPGSTRVYRGSARASRNGLQSGQSVTVYACCQGAALVASSIHIRKSSQAHVATSLLRGWVVAVGPGSIRLNTGAGVIPVRVGSGTRYTIGNAPSRAGGVLVGDKVSVRVSHGSGGWLAVAVHVYASSRQSRAIVGSVVSVSGTGIVVTDRGQRYTIVPEKGSSVSLAGRGVPLSALRPGDRIHATGRMIGPSALSASRLVATRKPPKLVTVRGTVAWIANGALGIKDATGQVHRVEVGSHVPVLLHHQNAPRSALFPGVRASARGITNGSAIVATTVTVSVSVRSVIARVVRNGGSYLSLERGTSETIRVDLPAGVAVVDGARRVQVGAGAYVQAAGYVERTGSIRATSVRVVHKTVSLSGVAVADSRGLSLQTSAGDRYRLRVTAHTQLSTGRETVTLKFSQLPNGAKIHVDGTIGADGTVSVGSITVRLSSVRLRGTIASIGSGSLAVTTASGSSTVRLSGTTTFAQGSHVLALGDLVIGDDVTVYGYAGAGGSVLARKILVHRRIVGMDGTVEALTATGFVLSAADGSHQVLLQDTTIWTGLTPGTLAAGIPVHVTGYRRGDGSILATRVRAGKVPRARAHPSPTP